MYLNFPLQAELFEHTINSFGWQIKIAQMKITTFNTRWGIKIAFY